MELLPYIVLLILVFVIIRATVVIVPQGYQYTLERFGRYTDTRKPGLSFLIPFFYKVGQRQNMMEQVLDVMSQEVITRDNAVVRVDGVVFYQIIDAARASYEVSRLENAILNLTMTNIRTVLGGMTLDESLSKRDTINTALLHVVDEATTPWGVKVTRIEIKDIAPPQDLVDAMARQMKAEREKRARILEAEGIKQAEILRSEGEKTAAILDAEGRKESAFRDSEAREREAEAEANATRMVSEAISNGNVQAINYFVAQEYMQALKHIAGADNQKVIFMPLEAASVIGSLGGITELAKEAFEKK